jgi:hypothetical protein
MKIKNIKSLILIGFLSVSSVAFSQCEIKNRIFPDGSMLYYIEPVNFYWTESKDLKGGIMTDKENYFLALQPSPFPGKDKDLKLKDDLEMKLANDSVYFLEHFDTRYMQHDSVMQLLYLIEKNHIEAFLNFEAISVKINMGDQEGLRSYFFKLHKAALKEQLACFLKEEENKE